MKGYGTTYGRDSLGTELTLRPTSVVGRAFLERRTLHFDDVVPLMDDRVSRRARAAGEERLSHRAGGADDPQGRVDRRDRLAAQPGAAVLAGRDRPGPDLRRPGGDRDRERAPVQRDQGGARAADGDRRGAARHQRSPTDVQPVFDAIAERAGGSVRGARSARWSRFDGELHPCRSPSTARRRGDDDDQCGLSRCRPGDAHRHRRRGSRQAPVLDSGRQRRPGVRDRATARNRRRLPQPARRADAARRPGDRRHRRRARRGRAVPATSRSPCCRPSPTRR